MLLTSCVSEKQMPSYVDMIVCFAVEGDGVVQVDSNAAAIVLELRVPRVSKLLPKRVQHRVVEFWIELNNTSSIKT